MESEGEGSLDSVCLDELRELRREEAAEGVGDLILEGPSRGDVTLVPSLWVVDCLG